MTAEIFLLAISLSMDAFAISMCKGLAMKRISLSYAAVIAAFFGVFQALMPVAGWLLASSFAGYIIDYDHWVAFALLSLIGGKMIIDSFKAEGDELSEKSVLNIKELFMLAIATSIDAFAVGITFAFLNVNIFLSSFIIGAVTFALSLGGVFIGARVGARFKNKATLFGGIVLVLIGVKILLEHLGVI